MKRSGIFFLSLVVLAAFSSPLKAQDPQPKKEVKRERPAPQMAGIGMISPKHSCTLALEDCLTQCSRTGGVDCELECASDCNVCSLDFGEESLKVCRK